MENTSRQRPVMEASQRDEKYRVYSSHVEEQYRSRKDLV